MEYMEYDEDVLKHIKQVQLMILKDFIDICDENGLEYFAYGGTAIGAIRHGGFIPWDDDIDIFMLRDDYEKFFNIMQKKNSDKYKLLDVRTEKDYFFLFNKLMLKDTLFEIWWAKQIDFDVGIWIDIFVMDNVPNNRFKRYIYAKEYHILDKLFTLSLIRIKNYPKWITIGLDAIHFLLKALRLKPSFFKKQCCNLIKKYKNQPSNLVSDLACINYTETFNKKDFFPPKKIKFETIEIKIPNNVDEMLTRTFGDYMQIPPIEERSNHPTENIDFGPY